MAKKISDYYEPKPELTLVQSKCELKLVGQMKDQLKKEGRTWRNWIEAAMKRHLEEQAHKKTAS